MLILGPAQVSEAARFLQNVSFDDLWRAAAVTQPAGPFHGWDEAKPDFLGHHERLRDSHGRAVLAGHAVVKAFGTEAVPSKAARTWPSRSTLSRSTCEPQTVRGAVLVGTPGRNTCRSDSVCSRVCPRHRPRQADTATRRGDELTPIGTSDTGSGSGSRHSYITVRNPSR